MSQREIARRVGVSRKTVKRYITEYETLAQADPEEDHGELRTMCNTETSKSDQQNRPHDPYLVRPDGLPVRTARTERPKPTDSRLLLIPKVISP